MNLRNVTIWTTGVMMLLVAVLPSVFLWWHDNIALALVVWVFSGSPLVISFVSAINVERHLSLIILFVSTIAYCILYIFQWYAVLSSSDGLAVFGLFAIGIFASPVMIPAWIAAYVLDRNYTKKQEPQV